MPYLRVASYPPLVQLDKAITHPHNKNKIPCPIELALIMRGGGGEKSTTFFKKNQEGEARLVCPFSVFVKSKASTVMAVATRATAVERNVLLLFIILSPDRTVLLSLLQTFRLPFVTGVRLCCLCFQCQPEKRLRRRGLRLRSELRSAAEVGFIPDIAVDLHLKRQVLHCALVIKNERSTKK